jgi:hypothetical protein
MKSGMLWMFVVLAILGLTLVALAVRGLRLVPKDTDNVGKVHVADERQTLDRGRIGRQESMPYGALTLHGTLVDAGCRDRTQLNLQDPSIPVDQRGPAESPNESATETADRAKLGYATAQSQPRNPPVSASGITVDSKTLETERSDVLQLQVPDRIARQEDPACGITGHTSSFAFLMDNGRLLNLDAGGNVWAWQAVQATSAGQAMLSGKGPAVKPQVTIQGTIEGDKLLVDQLHLKTT